MKLFAARKGCIFVLIFCGACKIECTNVPVRYEPLVLPVRVQDEEALKACKSDLEYWKELAATYRDENRCYE